ncbi:MAG: helix-turn-helix domain-containing protein, partial [Verrucomicrobiales bacterium]|nr:helix-turn-helix domain-containing protein [Verrucomicrobiales bacterium]
MTVSRALRGAPKVAPQTRDRILAAVEMLGYQPDPH